MPEATTQQNPANANVQVISNAFEDMTTPGFGPEQADVKVISCIYASFDYGGTMKDDPVIAVEMNLRPIDGSNDGKDFIAHWPCGPKLKDFSIVNDGGALVPTGSRATLANTSNWAFLLKALKDASFDDKVLNGPRGICVLDEGFEMTIRQVPAPERDFGNKQTGQKKDAKVYTCLKIITAIGEKSKAKGSTKTTNANAAPASNAVANGSSSDVNDFILAAIKDSPVAEIGRAHV